MIAVKKGYEVVLVLKNSWHKLDWQWQVIQCHWKWWCSYVAHLWLYVWLWYCLSPLADPRGQSGYGPPSGLSMRLGPPAVKDFYHTKMAHILVSVYSVFFQLHSTSKPITINNIHITSRLLPIGEGDPISIGACGASILAPSALDLLPSPANKSPGSASVCLCLKIFKKYWLELVYVCVCKTVFYSALTDLMYQNDYLDRLSL